MLGFLSTTIYKSPMVDLDQLTPCLYQASQPAFFFHNVSMPRGVGQLVDLFFPQYSGVLVPLFGCHLAFSFFHSSLSLSPPCSLFFVLFCLKDVMYHNTPM